jgi:hypothetical protein
MLVHIVADHPDKISDLRPLFGSQHVITSVLLYGKDRLPKDCDTIIAAADLRNAENIAALKTVSTAFKSARRPALPAGNRHSRGVRIESGIGKGLHALPTNSASRKPKPAVFSLPRPELCTITAFSEASSAGSKGDQKNA